MPNDTSMYDTPGNDTPMNNTPKNDTSQTYPTGSGTPMDETPAQELDRLKRELEGKETSQTEIGEDIKRLKDEITVLGKAVAEIDKKGKDWETAYKKIKEQQTAQKSHFDREKRELEATLPEDQKKVVTDAKAKGETEVAGLEKKVSDLNEKVAKKKIDLAKAEAAKSAAEQKYKAVVDLAETDNTLLKDLTTIHDAADSEEKKNHILRQYFLILEGEDVLGKLDVPDVKAYTDRLNRTGAAVADAADAERAAKDELAKAQVELQKAQKDLSDAKKERRQKTLTSIPENSAAQSAG